MSKQLLKEAISGIVGKHADQLVEILSNEKYINEFLIAKKIDCTINQTRNLLYRLSEQGLVSSIRKKEKKKGWYTYFWKIEVLKTLEFFKGNLERRLNQIMHQIESRETKMFYICERCSIEYNEENALIHNFTCNECGNIFVTRDNSKLVKELKKNADKISQEIGAINEEVEKEREKIDKKREKEMKKEEREKEKKKAAKKAARKSAKKTAAKKTVKKVAKKAAKKAVKKVAKKTVKKVVSKKASKKTVKKAAKKSSGK